MTQAEFVSTVLPADVLDKNEIVQVFTNFCGGVTENLCFSTSQRNQKLLLRLKRFESVHVRAPDFLSCGWSYNAGKEDSRGGDSYIKRAGMLVVPLRG